MDAVWINFLYNPLIPIGILLSFLAVCAFLLFLRGFLSGALYLFTLNGNDEFLKPARIRVLWSFMLLVLLFGMWEMFKWLGTLITGDPSPPGRGLAHVLLILLGLSILLGKYLKKHAPN